MEQDWQKRHRIKELEYIASHRIAIQIIDAQLINRWVKFAKRKSFSQKLANFNNGNHNKSKLPNENLKKKSRRQFKRHNKWKNHVTEKNLQYKDNEDCWKKGTLLLKLCKQSKKLHRTKWYKVRETITSKQQRRIRLRKQSRILGQNKI